MKRNPNWKSRTPLLPKYGPALLFILGSPLLHGWGVTEVKEGTADWNAAAWTRGVPGEEDTVYIQDTAKVQVSGGSKVSVHGIRIGNTVKGTELATLQVGEALVETQFLVIGDARDSSANYIQLGGLLKVANTDELDFEMGNPANKPTEVGLCAATFAAGQASLGDLRFNLQEKRQSRLSIFGVLPKVIADSVIFETSGASQWDDAEINFVLSEEGVAPLAVRGTVDFGAGDRAVILVDGSRYTGGPATFPLLITGEKLSGHPKDIRVDGFSLKAEVKQEGKRLILVLE